MAPKVAQVASPSSGSWDGDDEIYELDAFVEGELRSVGGGRTYNVTYAASDGVSNVASCVTVVTVVERNDCQDFPCQNGGHCSDLLASSVGYHEEGAARLYYGASEAYTGTILRDGSSSSSTGAGEWSQYVSAHGASALKLNGDPGFQCSCVRGWEGSTCAADTNECLMTGNNNDASWSDGSSGAVGVFSCNHTDNTPCFGPCENGAVCTESSSFGSGIGINEYKCDCPGAFYGPNCEYLDECVHDPCYLSDLTQPQNSNGTVAPLLQGTLGGPFLCPVRMVCIDSDPTATDSYTCTCPSCAAAVFSPTEVTELSSFFEGHKSLRRKVATLVSRRDPENLNEYSVNGISEAVCEDASLSGCTDASMVGYNPAAAVDDGSCETPVEGCMDPAASNFNASANVYNWATHNSASLGGMAGLQCVHVNFSEPVNECATDPCNAAQHRLCSTPVGMPGTNATAACTDARVDTFVCGGNSSSGNSSSFACYDPNHHWPGDYVCSCQFDIDTGGYPAADGGNGTCGTEVLFENPYRERTRPDGWPDSSPPTSEECAARDGGGKWKRCGNDAGCVPVELSCEITNYQLTQLLKERTALDLFLEARNAGNSR